ncbi:MAG: hypothetical protein ACR2PM_18315, partial [Hyphomicrobiales bacterium]
AMETLTASTAHRANRVQPKRIGHLSWESFILRETNLPWIAAGQKRSESPGAGLATNWQNSIFMQTFFGRQSRTNGPF